MESTKVSQGIEMGVDGKDICLLVITDELMASTHRNPAFIKGRTSMHFARFIKLLEDPLCRSDKTILVKNVGDSLMMRMEISSERIGELLNKILEAQNDLLEKKSIGGPIEIRVLVALCDGYVVEGEDLYQSLRTEINNLKINIEHTSLRAKLPGNRGRKSWLCGDLFGPAVSRAFRGSGIHKGPELIVEDSVAKYTYQDMPADGGTFKGFHFGPRVAFSPIKGMEDIYDVRKGDVAPDNRPTWENKEHVWLRTVHQDKVYTPSEKFNTLALRQQQARVFTELVLEKHESILHWCDILRKIDNGANYYRAIGHVVYGRSWSNESVNKLGNIAEVSMEEVQLVVIGAYPEFDTYFNVREAILNQKKINSHTHPLLYARTTLFWEPAVKRVKNFWPIVDPGRFFVVLLGRDQENKRSDDPDLTQTQWYKTIAKLRLPWYSRMDLGLAMGEWDYFAIYQQSEREEEQTPNWEKLATICKEEIAHEMLRVRFYGCKAES